MATTLSISSPQHCVALLKHKPRTSSGVTSPTLPFTSPPSSLWERSILCRSRPRKDSQNLHHSWRISAVADDALSSDAQQIVTAGDGGVSTVIQALLFSAFIGLSVLTIGVIYIGVTDFLRKRETEKYEKEEAAKQKKGGKKGKVKVRSRTGPRGFGQKIDEDDFDE